MGLGNEGSTLKTSRAYIAGLGTTGLLIGSFFLLLTVGSTLVAFTGVPGAASNGDLSRIELRQQREQAARERGATLLAARNVLGVAADGSSAVAASRGILGALATGGPAGQIRQGFGADGPDGLRQGVTATPPAQRVPSTQTPAPRSGTGVVQTPAAPPLADTGSGSGSDSGTGTDSGSGGDTGSGTDTGTGTGTDTGTGTGTDPGGGSDSSGDSSGGTDSGSGTGTGTGTAGGTGGDTTPPTGGSGTPVADPPVDAGGAVGGILDDATTVVEDLAGVLGG